MMFCDKIVKNKYNIVKGGKGMKICVYGAASDKIDDKYKESGEALGRKIAESGHGLVFGGGMNGLMGAVARGVSEKGGEIIGVTPKFFDVDGILFEKCTKLIYTETMRERKKILEDESDAFVIAPGGVGTMDEFFEILTLKQLQQHNKPIAVFNFDGYYDDILAWIKGATKKEFISEITSDLFKVSSDIYEIIDYIESYVPKEEDVHRLRNLLADKR